MPDAPFISDQDLQQLYQQQKPGQAPPAPPPLMDQDAVNRAGGGSPALNMLSKYNDFLQTQQGDATDSTGGQPPMTGHTAVPGLVPTGGMAQRPGAAGGNPPPSIQPPMSAGGQGLIPPGMGTTPSVGLNNGNSLPAAPAGGSNMRIQNGTQTQDIQYSPNGQGGVQATTMRDAGTGLTFVRGPNGQYYPAGTSPTLQGLTPGQSFQNAGTNLTQAGWEADQASKLGMQPDPGTLEGLRQARLMGASPGSPVGQRVIQQAIMDYNQRQTQFGLLGMQNQNKIDLANIATDSLRNMQLEFGRGMADLAKRNAPPEEVSDYVQNMRKAMAMAGQMHGPSSLGGVVPGMGGGNPAVAPPPVPGAVGGGTATPAGGGMTAPPLGMGPLGGGGGMATAGAGLTQPDIYEQRQQMFGPEIARALGQRLDARSPLPEGKKVGDFATATPQLLTMMYQYDRSHPGTMQQYGNQFLDALKGVRGESDLSNFVRPDPVRDSYFLSDPNDEAQARTAFGNYMGSRTIWPYRLQDAIFGGGPRTVIAGSPAAQKAIAAMNEADRGKGLPARRGRAGTE